MLMNGASRSCRIAATLAAVSLTTACYAYRISAPERTGAVQGHDVVWSWLWGNKVQRPDLSNCRNADLVEVTTRSNLGYSLITVVTLGFASPVKVEWACTPAPNDSVLGLAPRGGR